MVYSEAGLKMLATRPVHGMVSALGRLVEADGVRIAFSSETDGNNGQLEKLASKSSLLVAHDAVPEGAIGAARALHMPPSVIGRIAHDAQVSSLLLSHRMNRTLGLEEQTSKEIARSYRGEIRFADDPDCYAVGRGR